jgi:predicted transcriptional regulator
MTDQNQPTNFVDLAAGIVSAYVSNNTVAASEIPGLINEVYAALTRVARGPDARREPQKPAVPPKRSVTPEYIVCLEDGKKFKSLRRHLKSQYGLTPEQYREKWGLAADYPMVAPNYAATRSALAKKMGLGQQRGRRK